MAAARFYSSTSGLMELQADISAASTTMSVDSTTGLPGSTPFTLVIEPGVTGSEEIVTVTNVGGTTLTITRGVDGTSATAHSAGSEIRHMATARDFREPQEHMGASANVHGVGSGSSVVGTDTVQTLTNKTLVAADADTEGLVVKGASSQAANILEVQDSAGTELVSVDKDGALNLQAGALNLPASGDADTDPAMKVSYFDDTYSNTYIAKDGSVNVAPLYAAATPFKVEQRRPLGTASSVTALQRGGLEVVNNDVATSPGAALSVQGAPGFLTAGDIAVFKNSSASTVAKFDKDGKLTAAAVTSSGAVSGTTGTFTGNVTADNVSANMPFASSSKAGKRLHWGTFNITTDVNGQATITHGCGFTPSVILAASGTSGGRALGGVDNITSTQCRLTWWWIGGGGDGSVIAPPSGNSFTAMLLFGE